MTDKHAWTLNMGPYTASIENESVGVLAETYFSESSDHDDPECADLDREARAAIQLMAHAPQLRDALNDLLDAYYRDTYSDQQVVDDPAVTAARAALEAALY